VDLRLLGPVELRLDDRPIELGPRKQRAVLAMLALHVGRTVSADHLVEGLWGEDPPSSAAKMVQLYVSHLRPLLAGSGAQIVTRNGGYELQLPEREVDAVRFERLVEESRAREALGLWRGDALADVAAEPFAAAEIRRLDELRLCAAETAIDVDLAAGRHAEVIGELEALVAEEPLREHLHAQRMLALYRSGRQSEALAAYRDARAELIEQIGVEPGGELRRLQDAILAHDPALDVPETADPEPERPPAPRPPRLRLLVAAAILVVAGVTAFGVIRVLEPDGLPGIDENAVGLIEPDTGLITAQYGVGKRPSAIVSGGGSVWIANAADGTVSRFGRDREQTVIPVGGRPAALAFGGGSLWVADSDARTVAQIDPGANKVLPPIEVGNAPRSLAAVDGAVWVASGVDGRIRRIDLERGRVTQSVPVGANPSAIAAGAGALWVASEEAGTVTRIDPRTGAVVQAIPVGNGPVAVAVGEGAVWVVNRQDGTLVRLDPATNAVSWAVPIGRDPTAVAVGGGAVWVAGGEQGVVSRVDPDEPRDVKKLKTGNSPAAIAVANGSVWTAAGATQSAHRGGTLRVLVPSPSDSLVPMDWLDWHAYTTWATPQLSSLAYDGLVAYRRVEGAAGATIVGALATAAPAPSRDGRTYAFNLRPGIRFSDGTAVRPEDFRASMERFLRVAGTDYAPIYSRIVGAQQCVDRPARCDLSKGIETASGARTITIHLTKPDADLLHKLTLAPAFVVPGDSPVRSTTGRTPPGTGPYRVVNWAGKRGGMLVRNPHFRATGARPDGFADRIEVAVRDETTVEAQIGDVQRGAADIAVVANTFASYVKPDRLRALFASSPGRVHSAPAPVTDWVYLNVRRRPFDDPRVRQAVNLAFDRASVVELSGGADVGQATCQIIPSAFPGYAPYCPYTAARTPGGAWTAPDMQRARRLVKESGRAGERVRLFGTNYPASRVAVGRYLVTLLNRLGFRATQHVYGWDKEPTKKALARSQAGFVGWGADYISASTFIEAQFACAAIGGKDPKNLSRLCDPKLEAQIDRALRTPPADAAPAWAAADRRVTDLAAAVPMTNRRSVVVVSKRVGNVKTHAQWFTLLDQMWVR
jgi:ABC-type transport system substrate-binding protein/DNA-binding SARP family transcriptional activator